MDTRIETLEAYYNENCDHFKLNDRKEIEAMISNIKKPGNKFGKWWIHEGLSINSDIKSLHIQYETPQEGRGRHFQLSSEKYFKAEGQDVTNALEDLLKTPNLVENLSKGLTHALRATMGARKDLFMTNDCYLQWHMLGNRLTYIYLHSRNGMIRTMYPLD